MSKRKSTLEELFLKYLPAEPDELGCLIWQGSVNAQGYGQIHHSRTGKTLTTHRVAWQRVNGPIPKGLFVCHTCDRKKCVRIEHLFLGTHQDNMADMTRKGRSTFGEKNPRCKLTESQVVEIRRLIGSGVAQHSIAVRFGISDQQLCSIKYRRTWRHVR